MPVYFSRGLIPDDGTILNAPDADGTSGQALTTDGSGALSFASVSSDITGATASAPSPAADGDSDTGLFSDTADTLSLAAGGVEALRIEETAGDVQTVFNDGNDDAAESGFAFTFRPYNNANGVIIKPADSSANTSNSLFKVVQQWGPTVFEVTRDGVSFEKANVKKMGVGQALFNDGHFFQVEGDTGATPLFALNDQFSVGTKDLITFKGGGTDRAAVRVTSGGQLNVLSRDATGDAVAISVLGDGSGNAEMSVFDATPAPQQAHIADVPTGGTATTAELETAINAIIAVLETFGWTATS